MVPANVRIFVASQPVDFRGSFDRLSGFVRQRLGEDPRSGALFVFFNRAGNRMKILFFDRTGDCILYKRLDRRTFHGVVDLDPSTPRIEVNPEKLRALIGGIELPSRRNQH